jgi:hypothetical protein
LRERPVIGHSYRGGDTALQAAAGCVVSTVTVVLVTYAIGVVGGIAAAVIAARTLRALPSTRTCDNCRKMPVMRPRPLAANDYPDDFEDER